MSSLDQLLERRRASAAAQGECCHTVDPQPSCLIVATPTGESWVFPWSHLASARLSQTADELRLVFTTHEVTLRGLRLGPLRDLVATVRLATVRAAPAKHQRATDEPYIDGVTVQPTAGRVSGESA